MARTATAAVRKAATRGAPPPVGSTPALANPHNLPTFRAAYSDRTAALMAQLASIAYDNTPYEDPKTRMEIRPIPKTWITAPASLQALGFDEVMYFFNHRVDGWAYIAVSDAMIVLSFRGTQSLKNWGTNLGALLVPVFGSDAIKQLMIHKGFYSAYQDMRADGAHFEAVFREAMLARPNTPAFITGHSLGGALAQIGAARLEVVVDQGAEILPSPPSDRIAACYTYGSPRVGNKFFDLWVKSPSYRVIDYADIVPMVPFWWPYQHSGDPRYLPSKVDASPFRYGPTALLNLWHITIALPGLCFGKILGIEDHMIGLYAQKLEQIAGNRSTSNRAHAATRHDDGHAAPPSADDFSTTRPSDPPPP
jgi:triacylglycerol lipase